jgi:translation initiation factor IF-3
LILHQTKREVGTQFQLPSQKEKKIKKNRRSKGTKEVSISPTIATNDLPSLAVKPLDLSMGI